MEVLGHPSENKKLAIAWNRLPKEAQSYKTTHTHTPQYMFSQNPYTRTGNLVQSGKL